MKTKVLSTLILLRERTLPLLNGALITLKGTLNKETLKRNPVSTVMVTFTLLVFVASISISPRGRIVPLCDEMGVAYELLRTTETGRKLIKKVEKHTRGNLVYMMMGNTKEHNLLDNRGKTVRGVTRAYFRSFNNVYTPTGILIYTNRDITESQPREIVKNIAFELENVIYSLQFPGVEPGKDSPYAPLTQKLVCLELGM